MTPSTNVLLSGAMVALLAAAPDALAQAAETDWAIGRWPGYIYDAGTRPPRNLHEVVLVVEKSPDGAARCRYAYTAEIDRVRPLDQCAVGPDTIRFTSVSGTVFDVRRNGGALKGNGINPKYGLDIELGAVPASERFRMPVAEASAGAEWALGRWTGGIYSIGGARGSTGGSGMNQRPRGLLITRDAAGQFICRWSTSPPGDGNPAQRCRIGGQSIVLVSSGGEEINVSRSGSDGLVGTYRGSADFNASSQNQVHLTRKP